MSANEELTPEERLLKVIQQKKGASAGGAAEVPHGTVAAPAAVAARPAPASITPPAPPPPAPVQTPAAPQPAPVVPAARAAAVAPPVKEPSRAEEQKLKMAAPATAAAADKRVAAPVSTPPAVTPAPARAELPIESVTVPGEPPAAEPEIDTPEAKPARAEITIAAVNRYLLGIVLVVLVFVIYDLVSIKTGATTTGAVPAQEAGVAATPAIIEKNAALVPKEAVLERVAKRNVFVPIATVAPTNQLTAVGEGTALKLMAVSLDAGAESESMAILADQKAGQTYFVKCGQLIGDTGITLQRVLKDRVIVKTSKGETELQ